jgi:hypothetical protein
MSLHRISGGSNGVVDHQAATLQDDDVQSKSLRRMQLSRPILTQEDLTADVGITVGITRIGEGNGAKL